MKQATALKVFFDLQESVSREIGDTFVCDDERGEYLKDLLLVSLDEMPVQKKKRSVKKKEG